MSALISCQPTGTHADRQAQMWASRQAGRGDRQAFRPCAAPCTCLLHRMLCCRSETVYASRDLPLKHTAWPCRPSRACVHTRVRFYAYSSSHCGLPTAACHATPWPRRTMLCPSACADWSAGSCGKALASPSPAKRLPPPAKRPPPARPPPRRPPPQTRKPPPARGR